MDIDGTSVERKKGVSKRTAMQVDKKQKEGSEQQQGGWTTAPIGDTVEEPTAHEDKERSLQLRNLMFVYLFFMFILSVVRVLQNPRKKGNLLANKSAEKKNEF